MNPPQFHSGVAAQRGRAFGRNSRALDVRVAFLMRAMQGLTWRRAGAVVLFCALYGGLLGLDQTTGGAPRSLEAYAAAFVAALAFFIPAFLAAGVASSFAPARTGPRAVALGLAVGVGVAIGYHVVSAFNVAMKALDVLPPPHVASPLPLVVVGWLGVAIYLMQERDAAARQATHDEAERRLDLERQMAEAQMQVLESQIEPHFLFNCLAHVRRLYQTDRPTGRAMLRHLSGYLGAAIPAMREQSIELGRDLELAVAYLNIQQIRMGPRLEFEIDVASEFGEVRVPPMMITTLIENAIIHGLSPLPEGGLISIHARSDGDFLRIDVSDTGQGFQASVGTGVGLANVRARLAMLHRRAELSLSRNAPRGVTATIAIPR